VVTLNQSSRAGLTGSHQEYETLWSLEGEAAVGGRVRVQSRARALGAWGNWAWASFAVWAGSSAGFFLPVTLLLMATLPAVGREKDKPSYGEGLTVSIPLPEREVLQVVEEVTQNGIIRGTKEYNKDEFVSGAKPATSSRVFPEWTAGGKVFYKVREEAIDPRNFKDSSDAGTLVVRYVVQAQGQKNTVLRINSLFKEDFRHIVHQSNGSVETAEYQDIHEHIQAIEVMKQQNLEAEKERQEQLAKKAGLRAEPPGSSSLQSPSLQSSSQPAVQVVENRQDAAPAAAAQSGGEGTSSQSLSDQNASSPVPSSQSIAGQTPPGQTLEEHVKNLRQQLERLVKSPGAPLKSAPFHTASTLQSLPPGTEVLILISTPYWVGVETHEGQHGWIMRDDLEQK
jgi:hypothetical protein